MSYDDTCQSAGARAARRIQLIGSLIDFVQTFRIYYSRHGYRVPKIKILINGIGKFIDPSKRSGTKEGPAIALIVSEFITSTMRNSFM